MICGGPAGNGETSPPATGTEPASPLLARIHDVWLRLARFGDRHFPEPANPFTQLGAYANASFLIALVTGVLLLLWYKPSVHEAHASLRGMEASPWLAGLVQSLHRYSSDACVLFALVHGLEALLAGRFQRPRWLAWMSGLVLAAGLWAEGWLGYWLVWDDRAQAIALQTAAVIDRLPILEEPLARSFLARESLSSLFFFVVFFIHMLVPLAFALGLWLHIAKLNKPRFLTGRAAFLTLSAALALLSLVFPARAGSPADPGTLGARTELDLWYMLPLLLEGKAGAPVYAALFAASAALLMLLPFLKGRIAAARPHVEADACTGCKACYEDCPFNAISLLPDETGKLKAVIDESACLACGNCVGACNPRAVDYPEFPLARAEEKVRDWFGGRRGEPALLAFLCANSAAGALRTDPDTGLCPQLPGYRCFAVPCTGWILPRLLELASRCGVAGALIAGCGPGTPTHRLGTEWTFQRLMGRRLPSLSERRVGSMAIGYAMHNRPERRDLLAAAQAFRDGLASDPPAASRAPLTRRMVASAGALAALLLVLGAGSAVPHAPSLREESRLTVSFKHTPGLLKEARRDAAADSALLPHMRGAQQMARERRVVRLRVAVDGKAVIDKAYPPRGLFRDGASAGIAHVPLAPGRHKVEIAFLEEEPGSGRPAETFAETREIGIEAGRQAVVLFQGKEGFTWH